MKCPHCLENGIFNFQLNVFATQGHYSWATQYCFCPNSECKKNVVFLLNVVITYPNGVANIGHEAFRAMVFPKGASRTPLSKTVPEEFANDYKEACLVLGDSAKASAALSRRCLQHLLREVEKVKKSDLDKEIQEVIDRGKLPSVTLESLDAVRVIGNFAAHTTKSKQTGEVLDVEPGEAEWNLDVLESLFDYYFVQPTFLQKKRDALNQKLKDAGKPPLK